MVSICCFLDLNILTWIGWNLNVLSISLSLMGSNVKHFSYYFPSSVCVWGGGGKPCCVDCLLNAFLPVFPNLSHTSVLSCSVWDNKETILRRSAYDNLWRSEDTLSALCFHLYMCSGVQTQATKLKYPLLAELSHWPSNIHCPLQRHVWTTVYCSIYWLGCLVSSVLCVV